MSTVTVDELIMRISVELDKFKSDASQAEAIDKRLRKSLKDTEGAARDAGKGFDDLGGDVAKSNKELESKLKTVISVTGKVVKFFGVLAGSNALQRFTLYIAEANDQLGFMSKRLDMAARDIKALDGAVAGLGGAGASANATIRNLNQGIQEMVLMGNDALIPFFGALGVGVVDATGDIRKMDAILLDMADSLSQMDPAQAYALANAMGLDDGVANALIQGRDAMQEQLDLHHKIYVATESEIRASRELNRAQAFLSAQWEGLQTMIAGMMIPALTKMTKVISGWVEYLSRNERTVKNFFEGLAIAVGVILIPVLAKAAIAMLALVAPILGTAAVVGILAGAFALLYDDYKTWSQGGKSLFDWEAFDKYINDTSISVDSLSKGFAKLLTGYESLAEAGEAFSEWLWDKGIVDENGISIRGLAEAFKQLGKDIFDAIPAMQTMIQLVGAIMEGRWSDALSLAKSVPGQMLGTLVDASGSVASHAAGAFDTMVGSQSGGAASAVDSAYGWIRSKLGGVTGVAASAGGSDMAAKLAQAERSAGLPAGILGSVIQQETGGNQAYINDPAKYHYGLNAQGKRVAGHTGKISTAFGPFGLLESTAADPGYGVDPLKSKDMDEQIRFAAEYLAARIRSAGSVEAGLAGYGEGDRYSRSVMGRLGGAEQAMQMSRGITIPMAAPGAAGNAGGVQVTVGQVNVQTSAATLPAATAEGVAAGVARSNDLINQIGGGIQ